MNEYEQLVNHIGNISNYHLFINYLHAFEEKGLITLYAGTYSLEHASKLKEIEHATFYFYWNEHKSDFCFHINRMGWALKEEVL